MNYALDKEIFTRNKRVNILNKLESYLSRTNCSNDEMIVIMDAANNMEIEKLEELEKYLDKSKKGALYDGTYIIEYIYDLMNVDQKSEKIVDNIELEDETVMEKLGIYLIKSNCSSEEINEIFELSDIIIDKNVDDLDKVEQYIDSANKNEIYNVSYLRNIMNEIISKYSNDTEIVVEKQDEIIEEESLEDEEIKEEIQRDKKSIKNWFKEKFSRKEESKVDSSSVSTGPTEPSAPVKTLNKSLLQVYVDEFDNNFVMNTAAKELGFITKEDLEITFDGLYLLSDEELEMLENNIEIEIEYIDLNKTMSQKLLQVYVDENNNNYILTTAAKELNIEVRTEEKLQLLTEEELNAIEKMEDIEIEYVDIKTKNGGKEEMKSNKIVTFFKTKFSKKEKDVELEDEEIKEVKRDKKGIKVWFKEKLSKKEKTEKKPNKIVTFFKTKFSKKDIELEDEEIQEVTERQKIKLFNKKEENVEKETKVKKEETKYEDLSIQDKLFKYLHGTKYTWKDLINIVNKVAIINENEKQAAKLNEFLDKNKNLDSKKKVAALVYEIVDILGKVENKESTVKINPMCEQIKEFFAKNNLDENEELINLYNEIINNDDNIDKLYDYVLNNMEEAKNTDNIINEMNKILGKEVENKLTAPKVVKAKIVPKTVVSTDELTIELPKETKIEKVEEIKTENRKEISYDKYKQAQDKLNDKLEELEYLKHEYNVLEKSVYGKSFDKLSVEKKRDIMLTADSQKLMQLKEKLSEIKEVQQQIDKLSLRVGAYYMKYGVDVKSTYEEKYSQDYNEAVTQREREDKMDESLYLFNKFNDDEMAAVYKYMNYEKTLK